MAAEYDTNSKIFALRAAQWIGCSGAHRADGKWMPCETHEELERLSNAAEPQKKSSYLEMNKRYFKRRAKGKNKRKGWEKLNETKPLGGFATLEGGGIVSAPINSTIYSGGTKSYIPGVSPRDNDPDVFTDIESARKRSRMLGCIGVRRMPSATGRTVWLPCTNNTDYARVAGTTFLGRRNQQESQRRMIRTIVRRELQNTSKNQLRKKSLFEELSETKGLGRAIGRATAPGSLARRMRRSLQKIEGVLDPNERRDMDKDGLIFDGTWREMPAPSNSGAAAPASPPPPPPPPNGGEKKKRSSGFASATNEIPDSNRPRWASPTNNNWLTPKKIKKGGNLKTQDLLDYDRLRLRRNRDEQAMVLGVSRATIDAMYEPDASIDSFDADRLIMSALNLHPALIFGDSWLMEDAVPGANTNQQPKTSRLGKLDERDKKILDMRANGQGVMDIANELGVSKQRASQLLQRALKRNEIDLDSQDSSSSKSRGLSSRTSVNTYIQTNQEFQKVVDKMPNPGDYLDVNDVQASIGLLENARDEWRKNNPLLSSRYEKLLKFLDNQIDALEENGIDSVSPEQSEIIQNVIKKVKGQRQRGLLTEIEVHEEIAEQIARRGLSSSTNNPMKRGDGMIKRDERGNPIREGDRRKESLESSIAKLKKLGMTEEEINLLMTGDRNTPVDAATPNVDITEAKRNPRAGLASQTGGLRSMSLSQMAKTSPSEWPENQKRHITDWANSKPSFNVPYALAQKFNRDGSLTDVEWQRLLNFYTKYGPENRGGLRSSVTSSSEDLSGVGAKRMAEIILARVRQDKKNKKPGTRAHFHIVGPGAMGKSTLRDYLVKTGMIPPDSEAAHVDPDFIKQGIVGYNGGRGSVAVHRESARSATKTVDTAAKEGMDIVTEGTGYRLYEYKTTSDPSYKKIVHIPFLPFDKAEERLRKRNAQGGRQLPVEQIRTKGQQFYGWLTNHINNGEVQDMYIWDMDVPLGAAPRVIAKIENGVFRAIDEPAFKKWSEQSGGTRGGDSNLAWFKRRFPEK